MAGDRLDYELDVEVGIGAVTAHGGVPALVEHFRSSGAAAAVDGAVSYKKRKRGLTASQTARDVLDRFEAPELPLLGGGASAVREKSRGLRGLGEASAAVVADLQRRAPRATATIDLDATVLGSTKRAAKFAYDGQRGYQPVVALWAEQDVILADEFRDGNVSASSGNKRVIERALTTLPEGVDQV